MKNEKTSQSESSRPTTKTVLSPLDHSILLQPMCLNRKTPQWDKPLKTTRITVTKSRAHWEACHQLVKLTVADFRAHLATGSQDVPLLTAEERSGLCQLFKAVPDDALFWEAVEAADHLIQDEGRTPTRVLDEHKHMWGGQYFHERFTGQPKAVAHSWVQIGLRTMGQNLHRMT